MPPHSLQHELGKKHHFAHPEEEAYLNLIRTARVLEIDSLRLFRPFGLSEATYNALRILRGHEPKGLPSQMIGQQMVSAVPDVTRLVDRLCGAKLAQRRRDDADRRVVTVRITPKGLDLLAKLDQPLIHMHKAQLAHMSRAELAELNRLLFKARHPELAAEGTGAPRR
ncbi:MAG: winged helix DNA-binding protein [Phycisphaerales bacterium]|nr:winged helix DNA-binding protein [Phycisphaerales bacterium]